jgi:signal transduction histidine kinase
LSKNRTPASIASCTSRTRVGDGRERAEAVLSRSIVEAHGGRLWATANDPRGAVFQFTLPIGARAAF